MAPPDSFDADLSALRTHVDNLGVWLAIWEARVEPDAPARRCASDAVDALDTILAEAHGIRARLVGDIRRADDAAAARVDELLARTRREAGPRPYCLPGCDRLDGHDGRDPGACMRDGTVLSPPGQRQGTLLARMREPPG